jgi:hypothetical protein
MELVLDEKWLVRSFRKPYLWLTVVPLAFSFLILFAVLGFVYKSKIIQNIHNHN